MRTCLLLITLILFAPVVRAATVVEEIIAKVGGDIITKSDYDREASRLHDEMSRRLQGDELKKQYDDQLKQLLDFMINQKLLEQRAKDLNINVEDDINSAVARLRQENNIPDDQALDEALHKEGSSVKDLRADFHRRIIQQRILWNYVQGKVNITEDQIRAYYEQHKTDMMTEPTTKLQRYYVSDSSVDKETLKTEAQGALAKLRAGEDPQVTDFPHLKKNDSTEFPKSEVEPKLAEILDATAVGGYTDLIETTDGFSIIKVEDRKDAAPIAFEEARGKIYNQLLQDSSDKYQQSFLEDLRKQSYVVINTNPAS